MKKLSILLALALVFTLSFSAVAGTFPDVDPDHWAYDAIQELAATGVIEGYPDGEYKGDQAFTRYEFAVAFERAWVRIQEDNDDLYDILMDLQNDVDRLKAGLTVEQAEAVESIVNAMLDEVETVDEEEIAQLVERMTSDLQEQVDRMEVELDIVSRMSQMRYDTLTATIEDIEATLDELPEDPEVTEDDLAELQTDIRILETQLENVQGHVGSNMARLGGLLDDVDELQAQMEALQEIQTDVDNLVNRLNRLEVDVETAGRLQQMRYHALNDAIEDLGAEITAIEEELAEEPTVQFVDPAYSSSYYRWDGWVDEGGDYYLDPYDFGNDDEPALISTDDHFNHEVGVNVLLQRPSFVANLDLSVTLEDLYEGDHEDGFTGIGENIRGEITTDNLTAVIDSGQEISMTSYLFTDPVDGVTAVYDEDYTYALHENAIGGQTTMGQLLGISPFQNPLNINFGAEYLFAVEDGGNEPGIDQFNGVVGMDTLIELAGFDITPTFAVSDIGFAEYYMHLNVARDAFGPIQALEFNYHNNQDLVGVHPSDPFDQNTGYDIYGGLNLLNIEMMLQDYEPEATSMHLAFGAYEELFGFENTLVYENQVDYDDASYLRYNLFRSWDLITNLTVETGLNYVNRGDDFAPGDLEVDPDDDIKGAGYTTDEILGTLFAQYAVGDMKAWADLSRDFHADADPDAILHEYGGEFTPGIFGVTAIKYLNQLDNALVGFGTVNMDKDVLLSPFGLDLMPYAYYGIITDQGDFADEMGTAMEAGIDAEKAMTDSLTMTGGYRYGNKEFGHTVFDDSSYEIFQSGGILHEYNVGLDYEVVEGINADLSLEDTKFEAFEGSDDLADYEIRRVSGGLSVEF